MTTAPRGPCAPTQALANAVLLSGEQLLRLAKEESTPEVHAGMFPLPANSTASRAPQNTPPPLPARPTPILRIRASTDASTDTPAQPPSDSTPQSYASSPTLMGDAVSDRSYKMEESKPDSAGVIRNGMTPRDGDVVMDQGPGPEAEAEPTTHDDIEMTDNETVAADNERPETDPDALLRTLKIKHDLTMTQQDVDEMMGRVMGLIQASIKPTSLEGDIQTEVIMQTFFFKVIMHTVSFAGDPPQRQDTRTAEFFRNLTAYPAPDGPCTLYQALDKNFDKEEIEGTTIARYSAVESLPPILHILVQRTKGDGTKNPNPVVIEERLELDRYMDAPEGSELMFLRETSWALKKHRAVLTEQENQLAALDGIPPPPPSVGQESVKSSSFTTDGQFTMVDRDDVAGWDDPQFAGFAKYALEMDGYTEDVTDEQGVPYFTFPAVSEASSSSPAVPTPPSSEQQQQEQQLEPGQATAAARQKLQEDLSGVNAQLESLFAGPSNHAYALHSIVCHSGSGRGGHYWVWIRDFEEGVWRKYNDTSVSEERDTRKLLDNLNSSGDPYFLCYVREEARGSYVRVPKREVAGLEV